MATKKKKQVRLNLVVCLVFAINPSIGTKDIVSLISKSHPKRITRKQQEELMLKSTNLPDLAKLRYDTSFRLKSPQTASKYASRCLVRELLQDKKLDKNTRTIYVIHNGIQKEIPKKKVEK